MPQRITDIPARMVEQTGWEIAVELLVDGVPVKGLLTSTSRYGRWTANLLELAFAHGNQFRSQSESEPPSDEEREAIKRSYDEAAFTEDGAQDPSFPQICLRDAVVQSGVAEYWKRYPFLLIDADRVGGIVLGYYE